MNKQIYKLKTKYSLYDAYINFLQYGNGRVALEFADAITGESILRATVNIPDEDLAEDEVFIKNYAENEGILDWLIENNIVSQPLSYTRNGFESIPRCKLLLPVPERATKK